NLIAKVNGSLASIITAERTALNFLQHLSGIASTTNKYVQAIQDHNCTILDTRKTTPGLRELQKYAVSVGGGKNHRKDLSDGVLIKDNHIKAAAIEGLTLGDVIRRARERAPSNMKVEVEVETLEQVQEAVAVGADIILLDNMTLIQLDAAVSLVDGRAITEASGNVTLANVADIAATGVDMISIGALTHSANALDISLDIVEIT
ncbi:MAG: carboxylating nicotinate-nucleotide diphosphorylase, partial [SAR202 cluster bacterium]|nr:carboxylating nicotinate-nucleotide diphosphorylase [SAR202 cluster bacterium]